MHGVWSLKHFGYSSVSRAPNVGLSCAEIDSVAALLHDVFTHCNIRWYCNNYAKTGIIGNLNRHLTHGGRYKMAAISQTTFWSTFSWMKIYKVRLKCHWNLFLLDVQITIFRNWSAPSQYLNQWWLAFWCIYASPGLNELKWYNFNVQETIYMKKMRQSKWNERKVPFTNT